MTTGNYKSIYIFDYLIFILHHRWAFNEKYPLCSQFTYDTLYIDPTCFECYAGGTCTFTRLYTWLMALHISNFTNAL